MDFFIFIFTLACKSQWSTNKRHCYKCISSSSCSLLMNGSTCYISGYVISHILMKLPRSSCSARVLLLRLRQTVWHSPFPSRPALSLKSITTINCYYFSLNIEKGHVGTREKALVSNLVPFSRYLISLSFCVSMYISLNKGLPITGYLRLEISIM